LEVMHWSNQQVLGDPEFVVIDPMIRLFALAGRQDEVNFLVFASKLPGDWVIIRPAVENDIPSLDMMVKRLH
jgi:hypothetical protein